MQVKNGCGGREIISLLHRRNHLATGEHQNPEHPLARDPLENLGGDFLPGASVVKVVENAMHPCTITRDSLTTVAPEQRPGTLSTTG